jgi:hypothetical protein
LGSIPTKSNLGSKNRASKLEMRVANLEQELYQTRIILQKTLKILEEQTGKYIKGMGIGLSSEI